MKKHGVLAALVVAVVCLAATPSTALARAAIEVAPGGAVRKVGVLDITDANEVVIECAVSYRETWATRIPKIFGTEVVTITEGRTAPGPCTEEDMFVDVDQVIIQLGAATTKRYQGFGGTLPNITAIRLNANPLRILIRYREVLMPSNEAGCLYEDFVIFDTVGAAANRINRLRVAAEQGAALSSRLFGTLICPFAIAIRGLFDIEPAQTLRLLNT